jgi:dCMP deaminase
MAKQRDLDKAYMKCAYAMSELSHAQRKKVGAIIVAFNGGIIAEGFNGTPSGFDNRCEREEFDAVRIDRPVKDYKPRIVTKPEVLHAESNALAKIACSTNSCKAATLYTTLSPCFECAKLIIQARIIRVVYAEQYPYEGHTGPVRAPGLDLLREAGIEVAKLEMSCQNVDRQLLPGNEGWIDPDAETCNYD